MTAGSPSTPTYLKRETWIFLGLFAFFDVATHMLPIQTASPGLMRAVDTATALLLAALCATAAQRFWPSRR